MLTSAQAARRLMGSSAGETCPPSQRGAKIQSKSASARRARNAGSRKCTAFRTCTARSSAAADTVRPGPGTESRSLAPTSFSTTIGGCSCAITGHSTAFGEHRLSPADGQAPKAAFIVFSVGPCVFRDCAETISAPVVLLIGSCADRTTFSRVLYLGRCSITRIKRPKEGARARKGTERAEENGLSRVAGLVKRTRVRYNSVGPRAGGGLTTPRPLTCS
jgi:hypothetical protein